MKTGRTSRLDLHWSLKRHICDSTIGFGLYLLDPNRVHLQQRPGTTSSTSNISDSLRILTTPVEGEGGNSTNPTSTAKGSTAESSCKQICHLSKQCPPSGQRAFTTHQWLQIFAHVVLSVLTRPFPSYAPNPVVVHRFDYQIIYALIMVHYLITSHHLLFSVDSSWRQLRCWTQGEQ